MFIFYQWKLLQLVIDDNKRRFAAVCFWGLNYLNADAKTNFFFLICSIKDYYYYKNNTN